MEFKTNTNGSLRVSLTLITALMVCIVAVLAGASLWLLRSMHDEAAHVTATRAVLAQGKQITERLASQPVVTNASPDDPAWKQFSRLVGALHSVEEGIQYVSVSKDGITVFHEQMTSLDASERPADAPDLATNIARQINMTRRVLKVGSENVPVVVFNAVLTGDDGKPRIVEVALRKDSVGREEETAAAAIASMFKVSMTTTIISFAVCVLLVVWMMQREIRREKLRREQEHLVFAGVMANGIAHDFRNPMSSLKLDIQMLEKEVGKGQNGKPDRLLQLANRALNTMSRMDNVFQEFLYLSKPVSASTERLLLTGCVRECVEMLAGGFDQAGVRIELNMTENSIPVLADQTSLRRAIVNILTNALQFSKYGDTVSIRVTKETGNALLEITDHGPGIPKADRKRVFEMFVSTRPGGIGLGLFLARTAVERAGGRIEVVDAPAGGSRFRITLPLPAEEEPSK